MKHRNIISYLSFFLLLFVISCLGKPNIKFYETNHDFGKVSQNVELKHIFLFKNTGYSTLIIDKIKAG